MAREIAVRCSRNLKRTLIINSSSALPYVYWRKPEQACRRARNAIKESLIRRSWLSLEASEKLFSAASRDKMPKSWIASNRRCAIKIHSQRNQARLKANVCLWQPQIASISDEILCFFQPAPAIRQNSCGTRSKEVSDACIEIRDCH